MSRPALKSAAACLILAFAATAGAQEEAAPFETGSVEEAVFDTVSGPGKAPLKPKSPAVTPTYFHPFSGLFLERSTITFFPLTVDPVEDEPLLFEGEPAIFLPFVDNLATRAEAGRGFAYSAFFSFIPHLRMSTANSKPVRMPSYRPRLGGQLHFIGGNDGPGDVRHLFTFAYLLGHYSNGQYTCTFEGSLSDTAAACFERLDSVRRGESDPARTLNRLNGEFSTNVTGFKLGYKRIRLDRFDRPLDTYTFWFYPYWNLESGPGGILEKHLDLYGRFRLEGGSEYENSTWAGIGRLKGITRLGVRAAWLHSPHDAVPKYMVQGEAAHTLDGWNGLGAYLRVHKGQDPYNAFYVDDILQFQWGIIWDMSGRIKFHRSSKGNPS